VGKEKNKEATPLSSGEEERFTLKQRTWSEELIHFK
jgi:hypothetical protein